MTNNNTYGEILSKDAANQEFGSVINSVSMDSDRLRTFAAETNNLIMFYLMDNELYILGDNRAPLYPANSELDADIVCKVYSKTIFIELLDRDQETKTYIESRENTLTITNGNYTLEYGATCPPWCSNQ
jgi:hypothetical protein